MSISESLSVGTNINAAPNPLNHNQGMTEMGAIPPYTISPMESVPYFYQKTFGGREQKNIRRKITSWKNIFDNKPRHKPNITLIS